MKKKICLKCKKNKPLSDFYNDEKYYKSYCKKCAYIYYRQWLNNPENEKRQRECDKEYQRRKRAMGLIPKTEQYRIWRLKHPNGANAQQIINRMIKKGKIKRKKCEVCGEEKTYAHHDNYYEPLKVRWLCPSCHQKLHLGLIKAEK